MTANDTRKLTAGTKVFCTVYGGARGWWTFLEVRPRDGYMKLRGFNGWCPPHNFQLVDNNGQPFPKEG